MSFATQADSNEEIEFWRQLDPCKVCGSRPHDAPEGTHFVVTDSGAVVVEPLWTAPHCWKCGYRVGNDIPQDQATQFAMFQRWQQEQTAKDMAHPTMNPPENPELVKQELAQAFAEQPIQQPPITPSNPFGQ